MTRIPKTRPGLGGRAGRFLIEDFVDVAHAREDKDVLWDLQKEAARELLPGPRGANWGKRGQVPDAASVQQLALLGLRPAEFQALRMKVRDWLQEVVTDPRNAPQIKLKGPLTLHPSKHPEKQSKAPLVDGAWSDVFWFYVVMLVSRISVSRLGVCHAPKPRARLVKHEEEDGDECGRLFVRRGRVKGLEKKFCSETCRARVATQRARQKKEK